MGMIQDFYAVEKDDIIDEFDFRDNHGEKYGCEEFTSFSKDHEIYDWMHTLWEKKVVASPSHRSNTLDEEYLLHIRSSCKKRLKFVEDSLRNLDQLPLAI